MANVWAKLRARVKVTFTSHRRNETYAGHFVLQIEEQLGQIRQSPLLSQRRLLPQRALEIGPPLFDLAGLAIGNGLTDPRTQVRTARCIQSSAPLYQHCCMS